jgi:hypothetical protein
MRDFPTRPKGTLMSGAFRSSTEAERALRVLRNAGYARAEVLEEIEALPGAPILLRVDAAATGAFRAIEILEEHGAEVRFDSEPVAARPAEPAETAPAESSTAQASAERKPRIRRRNRSGTQTPSVPLDRTDVLIVTRGIESLSN